ncbi:MAG: EamA family transporter [Actinomycetota bacterium]
MAVLLGLLTAAAYGAADFFGGLSSRRSSVAAVVVWSQATSILLLGVLVAVAPGEPPLLRDIAYGAIAGVIGCAGLTLLYRGLAVGRMSVVAPITAVGAAVLPVAWGLGQGERPSAAALTGVALALVAVVFVSRSPEGEEIVERAAGGRMELLLALGAGCAFGVVFILLGSTSDDAGFWPLVGARPVSVVVLAVGSVVVGQSIRARRDDQAMIAVTGVLDIGANALYLVAIRSGLLSLVAVLGSLYPAMTVLLARVVLHERLTRGQLLGLGLAAIGVALIAAG